MTFTLSDPAASPVSPNTLPRWGPNIHPPTASTSLFGWPGDRPGRFHTPARAPFDRLKFWRVEHELTHRLKPYRATDVSLMFRQASWGTILYWSQLLDTVEVPRESLVDA